MICWLKSSILRHSKFVSVRIAVASIVLPKCHISPFDALVCILKLLVETNKILGIRYGIDIDSIQLSKL